MAKNPTYRPQIFNARTLAEAKSIILTAEGASTTEERWENETPFLTEQLIAALAPRPGTLLLDFGCGVGRLAKELIRRTGCMVLGVDIDLTMRLHAEGYVGDQRFSVVSPEAFRGMVEKGLRVDHAYTVWVLQHSAWPAEDIALIHGALVDGGHCTVVNGRQRCVPTDQGWKNDGLEILAMLHARFAEVEDRGFARGQVSENLVEKCFHKVFRKPSAAADAPPRP